jgi:hypothetical protein
MRSVVPKLALWAQTWYVHPFPFSHNGYRKNLNPVVAKMYASAIGKLSEIGKGLREINPHFHSTTGSIRAQSFLFGSSVTSLKGLDREPKNRYKP